MALRPRSGLTGGPSGPESLSRMGMAGALGPTGSSSSGAQHNPTYVHSTAEYVAVRRSDLREIAQFGWLEEGVGAAGVFFFSGAFWLALTLLAENFDDLKKYVPWFVICLVSILFGAVLLWIAHRHFIMRQQRIEDYFKEKKDVPSNQQ